MPSNEHDDACTRMFTNFCVSATDVEKAKTTYTHKERPSKFQEQTRKHEIMINTAKDDR